MEGVTGHTKIITQLARAARQRSLHSTLLFAGPEGIGKKMVAKNLAKALLCESVSGDSGCGNCRSCVLFRSGNHPDFVFSNLEDKDAGKVESIRGLLSSIQVKPYLQNGRVVILDNAHALGLAAANILLKTFEEPQKGNTFIIISSNPSKLPITLRSRCQVWGFSSLSDGELLEILTNRLDLKNVSEEILHLSDGSIGNAVMLIEQHELLSDMKEILRKLRGGDVGFLYQEAVQWAKQKDDLSRVLHIARLLARRYLLSTPDPAEKTLWALFLEDVNAAEWAVSERNLNPLLVLLTAFLRLIPDIERPAFTQCALGDTLGSLIRI